MMDLSVFRQLITGIFMVDIFLRFKEGVKINSDYILRNKLLFAKLEALCDFDDFGTKTCMTYSIYLISSIVYGEKDKKAKIKEAKQYFDPVNIKDCYSHPYDESMFKYFYDIVCLME